MKVAHKLLGGDGMLDVRQLKAKMVFSGYTQEMLAKEVGISTKTFWNRLKSGVFRSDEIELICKALNIDDPTPIFFCKENSLQATFAATKMRGA
jgi:hypothetical protein